MTASQVRAVPAAPGPTARWCLGTRLLVAATGAWAAFLVGQLTLNGRWWGWLLPATAPPPLFVAVPLLLLGVAWFARPVRRRAGGVLVLCLALGVPHSGLHAAAPWSGRPPAPPGALRVFSWNTEYWHQDDDPARFYAFLRAQRADVYLLQEYLSWDRRSPLTGFAPVDDTARLRREFPGFHLAARGELLTLSRFPIVARPPVSPDPAARGDAAADFAAVFPDAKVLRTDLGVGGRTVSVYNVHVMVQVKLVSPLSADFYAFPRDADRQRRRQLRGLSDDVADNPHPVLVAGDFNTSPAMADLRVLPDRLRDAAAARRAGYPASWPAGAPLWRLDWAFTSAGLRVHRYDFTSPEGLSDHLAQRLVLSVEPG